MRRSQLRSRSISVTVLVLFSSVALSVPRTGHATPVNPAGPAPQPIELRTLMGLDRHGAVIIRQLPFQGDTLLDGPALYRALHREDLVRAYERRQATRLTLAGAALVAILAGSVVAAGNLPRQDCSFPPMTDPFSIPPLVCHSRGGGAGMAAGVGLVLLGPLLLLGSGTMDPNPISLAERRALIDAFNATTGFQAPTSPPAPLPAASPKFSLGATATVSAGGAGLMLRGAF
jgi:hypothetical protein